MHISPSNKVYIGITCQPVSNRWGKDGKRYLEKRKNGEYVHTAFAKAILKYGWDQFEHRILFDNLSLLEANMIEEDLTSYYRKVNRSYNAKDGGDGKNVSEETKEKHHKALLERWANEDYKSSHITDLLEAGKNTRFTADNHPDRSRAVVQFNLDDEFVAEYNSATEAGKALNRRREGIKDCCNGKQKTAYGYKWKYKDLC